MTDSVPPLSHAHTDQDAERTVRVVEIATEADDVVSLVLADPDGEPLPDWDPGAHVDLVLRDDLERQYSLCGDPSDQGRWRVAVLREPESRGGSRFVHDELRAGSTLMVRGPRNHFPLVEAGAFTFIAGGIGITPLLPMIRAVSAAGRPWKLLYGGRRESSMAFTADLSRLGDRVTIWPEDRQGLLDLDAELAQPRPDTAVYCCGPEPLIAAVEERCAAWPAGALHVERFKPRPVEYAPGTAFEVVLERSGVTVTVGPDETILEAIENAGVDMPSSCQEGTCGTCETDVLEGVPDHRDSVLTDEERAENATMMVCCSRSLTPRLVLDA